MSHVFKYLFAVQEARFAQDREGEVEVRVVPGADFAADSMAKVRQNCRQHLGDTDVRIVLVEDILREKNGTLLAAINRMPEHRVRPAD